MTPSDDPLIRRFIEEAGNTTQTLGVGRVIGQIYAYLYFSEPPRTLDDMKETLGISKGSASMGVRQLEQWGAVQRIWVKGDRKDYYTANDYFGRIVRNIMSDLMGKRLASLAQSLDAAENELAPLGRKELLRESPEGSLPSTTKQPSNLTTNRASGASRASGATQQPDNSTTVFLRSRVSRLRDFQKKVEKTWNNPVLKLLLK
jgi:DNA-binding transcriptional regulator GbsR (MarR family)